MTSLNDTLSVSVFEKMALLLTSGDRIFINITRTMYVSVVAVAKL